MIYFFISGLNEIQELTKQSLRNKPFCLAIGKEWEENPRKTDLRKIHTDLSWSRKHRKAHGYVTENIHSITDVLSEDDLGEGGPVRILMQGKDTHACHNQGGSAQQIAYKVVNLIQVNSSYKNQNFCYFLFSFFPIYFKICL